MSSSTKKNKNEENPHQQSFDIDDALRESTTENLAQEEVELSAPSILKNDDDEHEYECVEEVASEPLSRRETREIVTPYAFTVSPDLLGQKLATPNRRGFAILIDLFCISVLSSLSALFFAGFVAITFFKAGDRLKQKKRFNITRLGLRASAALLVFFVAFSIVDSFNDEANVELSSAQIAANNKEEMESLMDLAAGLIDVACDSEFVQTNIDKTSPNSTTEDSSEKKPDYDECLLKSAEGLAIAAAAMSTPIEDVQATATDLINQKAWTESQKKSFLSHFTSTLEEEKNAYNDDVIEITQANQSSDIKDSSEFSVVSWIKGLMADLGLGLGWAALYFSVFTAWWRGQTIGKKLLGIEVVKLDGHYPNLWESFGRYGGYGAGFATGLLGFLQIYWDPNRQAIQDKISETLVLRLGSNK